MKNCPKGDKDCPAYAPSKEAIESLEKRIKELEKENKNGSVEKVETDLRKKKINEIIRRAVSQYLKNQK
jgi:hypothetical protein